MRNIQSISGIPTRKPRTRAEMTNYLASHFRYDTMNSWNAATSYALCVKLRYLNFPSREVEDRAYEMLELEDTYDNVNYILQEFAERHSYAYQIGFNGRSGGYLVLYEGGRKPSEYKRVCYTCGQKNYRADSTKCGRCQSENMHDYKGFETFTYAGRGLDMGEDFSAWEIESLRERVNVVWDFDQTCKAAVDAFVEYVAGHIVKEKTIQVSKRVRVAEEV